MPPPYFIMFFHKLGSLSSSACRTPRMIEPDLEYLQRLKSLELPALCDFMNYFTQSIFKKIACDEKHPLFSRTPNYCIPSIKM